MTNDGMTNVTPYNLPDSFYDFALMPKYEQNIESLAQIAEPSALPDRCNKSGPCACR